MSRAMNWVLLQLAMSYYGDSLKEFQVENDQLFISFEYSLVSHNVHEITYSVQYP